MIIRKRYTLRKTGQGICDTVRSHSLDGWIEAIYTDFGRPSIRGCLIHILFAVRSKRQRMKPMQ